MEQRWIPVAEQLPENIIKVWLSFTNQYASYVKSAFWNGRCFEHTNGKKVKDKPTAWKKYSPPEPYRGGEQPKQTNADRIRSMTDEELAEMLSTVSQHCVVYVSDKINCRHSNCDTSCKNNIKKWLRAESEEKHGE